jgi:outer membrane protein assembly factor BamB
MRSLSLTVAWILLAAVVSAGETWPQFRGPNGDGTSDSTGLPLKWSEKEHVRWKTPIHGKAWSSPVIWGNQIWLTTATEDGKELSVLCVDRESGQIRKDLKLWDIADPGPCHAFNSYASSTPVIEEGRVYVHFGSNGTACLDTKTAKILWQRRDLPCNHFRGPGSSPIVYKNLLILCLDGCDYQYITALDKQTGATVWKTDRGLPIDGDGDHNKAYGTPHVIVVDGREQLISPSSFMTFAYEPATGKEIWRVKSGGMNASARPLYEDGLLYITAPAGGLGLFAMKPNGQGELTKNVVWKLPKGPPSRASELLVDGHIYMVSDSSVAQCVNAKTGKVTWPKGERLGGDYTASPVLAEGRMYFFDQEAGEAKVIEPNPKEFKLLATNKLDDGCMASPAVAGKALFVRTRTNLYRIEN